MTVSAIKQQVKRRDRYSIYIDGTYAFSLSEAGLLEQGLATGQVLGLERLNELKAASGADKAYGNALRYVAMRPRSEWELATYLRRKEVDEPVAVHIIERLRACGLLDDMAFACAWVANRRLLRGTSKRRLQMELKQKHVSEEIITQALMEDEIDECDVLRQTLAKKRARYSDQNKLMQYLARQGFNYDDIRSVLAESSGDE